MKKNQEKGPWLNILHMLIKFTPRAYGIKGRYPTGIDAASEYVRGKGSIAKHEDPVPEAVSRGTCVCMSRASRLASSIVRSLSGRLAAVEQRAPWRTSRDSFGGVVKKGTKRVANHGTRL